MKALIVVAIVLVVGGLRIGLHLRRRSRRAGVPAAPAAARAPRAPSRIWSFLGDTGLVAGREIRSRVKAKAFRVVTLVLLAVVAAAIVIPLLTKSTTRSVRIGVVGALGADGRVEVLAAAKSVGIAVTLVPQAGVAAAEAGLRSGDLDLAVVGTHEVIVDQAITADDSSDTAQVTGAVATVLGLEASFAADGLSPAQQARITGSRPVPVQSLRPAPPPRPSSDETRGTSLTGIIIVFVMLSQYETWTLIGVMEEKSSRVVEVLLATVRPLQLLGGKVLGIGAVALTQATAILAFAFALSAAVGSSLLHGKSPTVLLAALLWLVLGYAFYCWVYAAAGSMAERQEQVQSLALPLSVPMIVGYILALTTVGSGQASLFVKVLAYLPPTAPFEMPLLVGFGAVPWWGFVASALISLICTVGVARVAALVYRRAVLRTGRRVTLREVLPGLVRH